MQQVQGTILDKVRPGINPIFIVSPNVNDGTELAKLLSYHLRSDDKNHKPNHADNHFINGELQGFFATFHNNKVPLKYEDRDSLKFILDRYFANNELWGLQVSYQLFFELGLDTLYKDSFFIVLYGSTIPGREEGLIKYAQKALAFCQTHEGDSALLHVSNPHYLPSLVLQSLPFDMRSFSVFPSPDAKKIDTDHAHATHLQKQFLKSPQDYRDQVSAMHNANLLSKKQAWYNGKDVLPIFIANDKINTAFADKILQVSASLLSQPDIYILCNNPFDLKALQKLMDKECPGMPVKIIMADKKLAACINQIIKESGCSFVLIDNFNLDYSLLELLSPFRTTTAPAFCFSNNLINKTVRFLSDKIILSDILTNTFTFHNLAFKKELWSQIDGFDEAVISELTTWDFCIKALTQQDSFSIESPAILNNPQGLSTVQPANISDEVEKIFEKYKKSFESNLLHILQLTTRTRYAFQHEIKERETRLSSLSTQLQQSKENLNIVSNYNAQLQGHITAIERSKAFRLAKKMRHYTRIFRKGKKVEGNSVNRSIKFIAFAFTKQGLRLARKILRTVMQKVYLILEDRPVKLVFLEKTGETSIVSYNEWIEERLNPDKLQKEYESEIGKLKLKPKISVIVPVYNPPIHFLKDAIESVLNQSYTNWELCIADDNSPNPTIKKLLETYALKDPRIKIVLRETNGHISACSNSALALATGDYVSLLDHDDTLTPNALFEIVKHINKNPDVGLIYSDEDKLNGDGSYSDPFFKPDWSPDRFLAINYVSHLVTIDKKIVDQIGGFREGFEGSQDYDILLRTTELTKKVGHIPEILYHWRAHELSVADASANAKPYAYIAAKKAIQEALYRRHTPGEVQYLTSRGSYRINYEVQSYKKVSIIIPTKDQAKLMKTAIDSIIELTDYPNYEIVVLNNNSNTEEFFALMKEYTEKYGDIFRCIDATFPFNFSKLMNFGASVSTGDYLLFLNNDIEIIHADWMTRMVSYSQHKWIGCVGVKLLYPDDTIQHAGTVTGIGACAGHILVGHYKDNNGYFNCLQTTVNYSAVTAACLMVRREIFEEVNGWDETLAVEYNDVDFCLAVREKGYYNVYVADVSLYHYESATRGHPHQTSESYKRHVREVAYFKDKWPKYLEYDPYYNPNFKALNMAL